MFVSEVTVRRIIEKLYEKDMIAGLICELCYLRNFRVGDIRFAKVQHFRKYNGYPEIYLTRDKMELNQWYPIPRPIYNKIQLYIKLHDLKPNDYLFEITTIRGKYHGHKGVITHEWVHLMWLDVCKELGIYAPLMRYRKQCSKCKYYRFDGKCAVLGSKLKNCNTVQVKHCIKNGETIKVNENHPRLHETLRGAGAQHKIKHYMNQGLDYENAMLKIFHMSNWRDFKVFKRYMDKIFEKEIGDHTFVRDFGDKALIN